MTSNSDRLIELGRLNKRYIKINEMSDIAKNLAMFELIQSLVFKPEIQKMLDKLLSKDELREVGKSFDRIFKIQEGILDVIDTINNKKFTLEELEKYEKYFSNDGEISIHDMIIENNGKKEVNTNE